MMVKQPHKIVFLMVSFLTVFLLAACEQQGAPEVSEAVSANGDQEVMITELQIIDVVEGDGATASPGQMVVVHYTGWLYEPGEPENKGDKFDSSLDRNDPFVFPLGAGRVIQGWDQGFAGMQVGGKRTLIIPADMGYGDQGAGAAIPPGATLLFEVELLDVQ
jgi:FKBP-type peptidyl-prolyl cis-trans isomerase FkpA